MNSQTRNIILVASLVVVIIFAAAIVTQANTIKREGKFKVPVKGKELPRELRFYQLQAVRIYEALYGWNDSWSEKAKAISILLPGNTTDAEVYEIHNRYIDLTKGKTTMRGDIDSDYFFLWDETDKLVLDRLNKLGLP